MVNLHSLTDREILFLTLIGETRGEPIEGQVAVGCVIRNSFHSNNTKYKTWADVCLEPKQFSCWNENDPNRAMLVEIAEQMQFGKVPNDASAKQCRVIANAIISWDFIDNVHGAKNYLTKALYNSDDKPSWAKNPKKVYEHGNQVFLVI